MSSYQQWNEREYSGLYSYADPSAYPSGPVKHAQTTGSRAVNSDRPDGDAGRQRTVKIFKALIMLLLAVIVCQLAYHLYIARNIVIKNVRIAADPGLELSNSEILGLAGIGPGTVFFDVDCGLVESRLEAFPAVGEVSAEKHFPDSLSISVRGRVPLAVCLSTGSDGRTVPALVDESGMIFRVGPGSGDLDLPVLSGIKFSSLKPGMRMPESLVLFLKQLNVLRNEAPEFFNLISEFKFIKKNNDDFEVLMYPQNYSIPVRIGSRIDKEMFTYMLLVLDVVKKQGLEGDLEELDFRTNEVVYRIRGE